MYVLQKIDYKTDPIAISALLRYHFSITNTVIACEINKLSIQILEVLKKNNKVNRINIENIYNVLKCHHFYFFLIL